MDDKEHRSFLRRLKGDLRASARLLERSEARYLVDLYYQIQEFRKAAKNQTRDQDEPNILLEWIGREFRALEDTVKASMGDFADRYEVGRWSQGLVGVGPIIAAGLIAHIDIKKAKTAGSIWRFAGLDPTISWESRATMKTYIKEHLDGKKLDETAAEAICAKLNRNSITMLKFATERPNGDPRKLTLETLSAALARRPHNAKLKRLIWIFADCQMKFSKRDDCFYGQLYRSYKVKLIEKNEAGEFSEAAAEGAARVGKTTEAYKSYIEGRLPPGHIEARAKRWVGKMFISHWHTVAWEEAFKTPPPKPYVIAHMDHEHMIEVPR